MLAPCLLLACISGIQAISVYLSPSRTYLKSTLSPEDASAALSHHLRLEAFEPLSTAFVYEEEFVGQGEKNAVLVAVEESSAHRMYFQFPAYFNSQLKRYPSSYLARFSGAGICTGDVSSSFTIFCGFYISSQGQPFVHLHLPKQAVPLSRRRSQPRLFP